MQNNIFKILPLNDVYAEVFKNKLVKFEYYSPKFFKKVIRDEDTVVIGNATLGKKYKEDNDKSIGTLEIDTKKDDSVKWNLNVFEEKDKKCLGYVKVGDNEFIRIRRNNWFLVLIPFISIILILLLLFYLHILPIVKPVPEEPVAPLPVDSEVSEWDGDLTQNQKEQIDEQENTSIPGYANLYVSEEMPNIKLSNPEENTVFFKYEIYENDNMICNTDLIENGKVKEINFKELLPVGEHTLKFVISCYDLETQAVCNGANQTVKINVE